METREDTVRVWAGLNPLQAKLMEQLLLDNGIDCFASLDTGMFFAGGRYETSLWVAKKEEARARALLQEREEEMSAELDQELSDEEEKP